MGRIVIDIAARPSGGRLLAPLGMATPHGRTRLDMTAASPMTRHESQAGVTIGLGIVPPGRDTTLAYPCLPDTAPYPEAIFEHRPSRFTRAADALIAESHALAKSSDPASAIANHVAGLFTYGHPDTRFYDAHDHIPQLCSLTEGSCIDINAYFIAALRAAGIQAGYVTGYFFPTEKTDAAGNARCNDMHCWVVSRDEFGLREWDIAHHIKAGISPIAPALNPRPGKRFAVAHSMGLSFPTLGLADLKLISEPVWLTDAGIERASLAIRYEVSAH